MDRSIWANVARVLIEIQNDFNMKILKLLGKLFGWLFFEMIKSIAFHMEKLMLLFAVRKAKRMHQLTGKRYWVIKLRGLFRVYSTTDIKNLKAAKIFNKNIDFIELQNVAAYNTNEKDRF